MRYLLASIVRGNSAGFAAGNYRRRPDRWTKRRWGVTPREHDFKKALLSALGLRLDSFKIPVLVVVKKNKKMLEHLESWLTEFKAGAGGFMDAPVLVTDDEADSASVNTRVAIDQPTAINTRIFCAPAFVYALELCRVYGDAVRERLHRSGERRRGARASSGRSRQHRRCCAAC